MIFYEAVDTDGLTHVVGTQADAKAINRNFTQIDIPTDKAGLMARENERQRLLFDLRRENAGLRDELREANPPDTQSNVGQVVPITENTVEIVPAGADLSEECIQTSDKAFDPALLERQLDALAENPEDGMDAIVAAQFNHGVGHNFSRGVHILSVICAGEHQLARLFFRQGKDKKWGSK